MKRFLVVLVFALCCCGASGSAEMAAGGEPYYGPAYVILASPSAPVYAHQGIPWSAHGYGVTAPRYSYGWFGVSPRTHHTRHYGYYGIYKQWTAR